MKDIETLLQEKSEEVKAMLQKARKPGGARLENARPGIMLLEAVEDARKMLLQGKPEKEIRKLLQAQ